jgi:hypothetical protein
VVGVENVVTELTSVACPLFINRFVRSPVDSNDLALSIVNVDITVVAAERTNTGTSLEVPWTRSESILRRGESTDRADLNDVATELRSELAQNERRGLHVRSSESESKLTVARDFLSKANASTALDTALKVKSHVLAQRKSLWSVSLHLNKSTRGRPVEQRIVLERTLTTAVADRAVERVVHEKKFENALSIFVNLRGIGIDGKPFSRGQSTACLWLGHLAHGAVRLLIADLNQAHATHPDGFHPRVVAKNRDLEAEPFHRFNDHLPFGNLDVDIVDRNIDELNVCYRCHAIRFYEVVSRLSVSGQGEVYRPWGLLWVRR